MVVEPLEAAAAAAVLGDRDGRFDDDCLVVRSRGALTVREVEVAVEMVFSVPFFPVGGVSMIPVDTVLEEEEEEEDEDDILVDPSVRLVLVVGLMIMESR